MEKTENVWLECVLTEEELKNKGHDLAHANTNLVGIKSKLKMIQADFKAKITSEESKIESLSIEISRGTVYKDIECEINYNSPAVGEKTVIRLDTNEIVRTDIMSDWEKENLFIPSNRKTEE